MSTFHEAWFEQMRITRADLVGRVVPVLVRHGVVFEGDARGLAWNGRLGRFAADSGQEVEGSPSLSLAIDETRDWECACFDLRFMRWSTELYLFSGADPEGGTQGVGLSFPGGLFDDAEDDPGLAARWLALHADLGMALGSATMICGIGVLMARADSARLLSIARRTLAATEPEPDSTLVHTLLCRKSEGAVVLDEMRSAGWASHDLGNDYRMVTKLRFGRPSFDRLFA